MIIKKYIANDMKEAITRAKYEMGSEAVIVSQRPIKIGKWWNPFKKSMIEATFALEDKSIKKDTQRVDDTSIDKAIEEIKSLIKDQVEIKKEVPAWKMEEENNELIGLNGDNLDPFFHHSGEKTRKRLSSYCLLHNKNEGELSEDERKEFFKIILRESPFGEMKELSRINVLVGPTGVGKTTTIAKLAAIQKLGSNKKIGLITMDTYRIGAVQQLKTYAEILGVPFHVVNNPGEMKDKIGAMRDCDVILVDTLGTSPKDMKKLIEIKKNLNAMGEGISTYLVLSLSTDKDYIESLVQRYKILNYDAMVITKVDEVENTKNLWYLIEKNLVPIQYFCHGQDVPDDIKEATPENVYKYFEENFNYDRSSW